MKLDKNINPDGRGKYALLKLRRQSNPFSPREQAAAEVLMEAGLLDMGDTTSSEFFVIRLRDKYAAPALMAYSAAAFVDDQEWGYEVAELARKAFSHPDKKKPD